MRMIGEYDICRAANIEDKYLYIILHSYKHNKHGYTFKPPIFKICIA